MKSPSSIEIDYDGTDITKSVVFSQTTFTAQSNAVAGDCRVTCKDPNRVLDFTSLRPLRLLIDGQPLWGGVIGRVGRQNFFSAVDTSDLSKVRSRKWSLTGPDNNIYFDKRVLRDTANYLRPIHTPAGTIADIIKTYLPQYIDVPPGMTFDSVDNPSPYQAGLWVGQGKYWRDQMEDFIQFGGGVYYLDADMDLHVHAYETVRSPWAFVDHRPNGVTTIGFREAEYAEDALQIVTDALIWGGSALHSPGTNPEGSDAIGTVFARYPDPPANDETVLGLLHTAAKEQQAIDRQSLYGRWERAEMRVGQSGYMTQQAVKERAYTIINGATGTDPASQIDSGLNRPLPAVDLSWFAHDVPRNPTPVHLRAGYISDLIFYTMGADMQHPLITTLPLRSLRISFPTIPSTNPGGDALTYARFDGSFGISYSDPRFLWKFLLGLRQGGTQAIAPKVDNSSSSSVAGAKATLYPNEKPNGVRDFFTLPFPYLSGSTMVYLNGLLQRPNIEYDENDPANGQITFFTPPYADDAIYVTCLTNQG